MGGEQADVPQWRKLFREEDGAEGGGVVGGGGGGTGAVDAEERRDGISSSTAEM